MIFSTFLNSVKKNQNVLGVFFDIFSTFFNVKEDPGCFRRFFLSIFSTLFNSVKEDPGCFRSFFWQFLKNVSISNKTQDILGGLVPISSLFFNSVKKS